MFLHYLSVNCAHLQRKTVYLFSNIFRNVFINELLSRYYNTYRMYFARWH